MQVRELEVELEAERHSHAETQKGIRKQDRRSQELALQLDEEHKAQDRMRDMIEKLQQKIKAQKKQIDEAVSLCSGFWVLCRAVIRSRPNSRCNKYLFADSAFGTVGVTSNVTTKLKIG